MGNIIQHSVKYYWANYSRVFSEVLDIGFYSRVFSIVLQSCNSVGDDPL